MKKEIKSGIYIIRCLKSIKVYVGSAINLEKRKFIHFNSLKKNYHCNRKLQRSFNKYSEENFKFEVLEYVSRFENESKLDFKLRLVNDREQYYLDTILFANYNDNRFHELGYNINRKADSSLGTKRTKLTRQRQSVRRKGIIFSKEWCSNIGKANKNRIKSEQECKNISKGLLNSEKYYKIVKSKKRNSEVSKSRKIYFKDHDVWNKGDKSGNFKKCEDKDCNNQVYSFNSRNIKYCSNICRYKNAPRLTCEYCHRTFDIGNYSLHHGNLCNLNPNKITTSCII